jgi:LPXTG-motif cell wall-anchored protein
MSHTIHRPSSVRRRAGRRGLAALLTTALVATGAVLAVSSPAEAATHQVTGSVFRDFNSNGARDTHAASTGLASDTGLGGVSVTATDGKAKTVGTATTAANGTYSLSIDDPSSTDVRIAFTGLPAGYESSFHGADSGTSVQFVTVGAAPVTNVDFAVNAPEDFSQDVPAPVVTAIHSAGSLTNAKNATVPSLVSVPWSEPRNDAGTNGSFANRTTLGLVKDTGSLWGNAFQRTTGDLFTSAVLRRHAALGPLGLGGIYTVEDALKADGTINADADPAGPWLDVTAAPLNIDVGAGALAGRPALGDPASPSRDLLAYTHVGKVGIGGMATSSDGKLLYFVNLHDKKLYAISIADKTLAGSYSLGLGADERPWAVSVHRGKVYVGSVETGEDASNPAPSATNPDPDGLDMVVRAASEADLGALASADSTVLTHGLGYTRGGVYGSPDARFKQWHGWTDAWNASTFTFSNWPGVSWAQAMLSDITFDTQGEMILGLQDRFSLQSGNRNYAPTGTGTETYEAVSLGDVLIASPDASGQAFTLEADGTVGGRTTANGAANEGPGGKEFFADSNNLAATPGGPGAGGGEHHEIALGGLTTMAGIDQVVATAFDPTRNIRVAGQSWFSTRTGTSEKGYQQTNDGGAPPVTNSSFQKAGGLGDVQALANLAPLEIGNRVWFDADQDGVQDADEPGIDGVQAELFAADADGKPTGPALKTTTTTGGGAYYFDVDPTTTYVVVFTPPTSGDWVTDDERFGTVPWKDMSFTKKNPADTTVDSNAGPTGQAPVTTGGPGQNDHTIDAGLVANTAFTVQKLVDSGGGASAAGQEFTIDLDAKDFRGDALTLPQSAVTLEKDETSVPITVPAGTLVKLSEASSDDYDDVTVSAPAGATKSGDYYRVEGRTPSFAFRLTNKLFKPGTFEVTKAVTGDFDLDSPELADATFTVHYEYAGGSGDLVLDRANGFTKKSPALPYGVEVTLTEPTITGQGASVDFATPTWKIGTGDATKGTSTSFVVGNGTTAQIALTNPATELTGGFDLTKQVTGDGAGRVPDAFQFVAEYSTDGGTTWTALGPVTKADPKVAGPQALPVGTKVLLREKKPADLADVDWVSAVFSGTGVTPATDDDPASFVVSATGDVAVTLTNTTSEINGTFTITKDVTGPGEKLLEAGHGFTVDWTLDGDAQTPITLTDGGLFSSPPIAAGSKIEITEVKPTGGLPAGATWGTPVLRVGDDAQANGSTFTIGDGTKPLAIVLDNPTDVQPTVTITKGDGDGTAGTITHEADTVTDGELYTPGESRDIVLTVKNTGPEPLREVDLTDVTRSGGDIANLRWTFPDGSSVAADRDAKTSSWKASWAATFAPGTTEWKVGDVITGTATLTANASDKAHQDRVRVDAEGAYSGKPVDDDNAYNAFTAAIQVIKYDGTKADPAVKDAQGRWIVPGKPLADLGQDANDKGHSVAYGAGQANQVRWVVTNTGPTWLTRITLADVTGAGPSIGADWTADLTAFGGPADYSFVKDGPWKGRIPPGASFFARGTLTLPADTVHQDTVKVTGVPIVPATRDDGTPSDEPLIVDGEPVLVRDDKDEPVVLSDDDPFNAHTPKPAEPGGVLPDDETAPRGGEVKPDEENGILPDTGSGLSAWLPWGGLLLLVVGGGVAVVARRREHEAHDDGRHGA